MRVIEPLPTLTQETQEIAFEIALLGQRGLDINNPEQKYSLRTLPGKYSGLFLLPHINSVMHRFHQSVGVRHGDRRYHKRHMDQDLIHHRLLTQRGRFNKGFQQMD